MWINRQIFAAILTPIIAMSVRIKLTVVCVAGANNKLNIHIAQAGGNQVPATFTIIPLKLSWYAIKMQV
jgi:hypothetical protein